VVNSKIGKISNNTIIEGCRDVYFENIFSFKSRIPSDPSFTLFASDSSSSSFAPATDFESRKSKRIMALIFFGEDFFTYIVEGNPSSFKKAMNSSKSPCWKEVVNSEIKSIMKNNWILTDLPPGCKPVGCK